MINKEEQPKEPEQKPKKPQVLRILKEDKYGPTYKKQYN